MGAPEREGAAPKEPALPPLHPLRSRGAPQFPPLGGELCPPLEGEPCPPQGGGI